MQLPESLPPSFWGTAVRYSYSLEAHARYSSAAVLHHQRQPSGSSAASDTPQARVCMRPHELVRRMTPQHMYWIRVQIGGSLCMLACTVKTCSVTVCTPS